jgi:hypothetical protein
MQRREVPDRVVLATLGFLAASSTAAFFGWVLHDGLGYEWADIREAALSGAALGAFVYLAGGCGFHGN